MDIKNKFLEKACANLTKNFANYFDWNDMDISVMHVDTVNEKVKAISNNYEWLLTCWDHDLDLSLRERLEPGIQYWSNYSSVFAKILEKSDKRNMKVDFCNKYGNNFEIISFNSKRQLSLLDMTMIYKLTPTISDYIHQLLGKEKSIILPLRIDLPKSMELNNNIEKSTELLDIHQYMRFGNIRFTRKEIITIRLFLSHCRVKEISAIQGCSEASEHKRIQRIKEKLNCPYASPSGLFSALKEQGVTLACLETLVNSS
ncbi:helix-turn-helix transcriptional regulator [Providencia burhodogranariea]|uniref:Uncharacterized protein n=1 Tax=Providencia burhodogranariea DSM 19968 TaxID=1141662 RepID=K8W0K6_9GAMM|nr:hypothetical protein [Providencia burhodogranariea]EKT53346.1 hypothetical protein OOA_18554 [Providencia burhodogranariea DSM 19968]